MRYKRVYMESIGYELPPEVVTSDDLESRLAPIAPGYEHDIDILRKTPLFT